MANVSAVFNFKLPNKWCLYEAMTDVMPTINRECVVAFSGVTPNRYTSMGTARIEPPLPMSPKDTPMSNESI